MSSHVMAVLTPSEYSQTSPLQSPAHKEYQEEIAGKTLECLQSLLWTNLPWKSLLHEPPYPQGDRSSSSDKNLPNPEQEQMPLK